MPFLSIIIPVYKVESYLRECLDSVAASTLDSWEAILIDDGSPDGCPQICDEYALKDSRFKVIHQENAGVAAARNAGLDVARGEWVWFVDSDDVVDMRPVGEMMEWLKNGNANDNANLNENIDLVMFDLETFVDNETELSSYVKLCYENEMKQASTSRGDATTKAIKVDVGVDVPVDKDNFLNKYISFFHQQIWFRRSAQFRFTNGIRVSEDLELMYKYYTLCQQPVKIQATLYHYRVRETSVTQDEDYRKKAVEDLQIVLRNLAEWVRKYEIKPESWLDFRMMKLMQNLLYSASQVSHLDYNMFQEQFCTLLYDYRTLHFPFANCLKYRIAERSMRAYFCLNKLYLRIKNIK